jgi:tRNA A37 threonylcarbamoyladenosine dehydratase
VSEAFCPRPAAPEAAGGATAPEAAVAASGADLERRFGGLARLYGEAGCARLRRMSAAVIGLGGVGSWAAEALARCGVARLVLIDFDHVAESNVNRQVQATGRTLGIAKTDALAARLVDIHPGAEIVRIERFVEPGSWPSMLGATALPDLVIDACDDSRAKLELAAWARTPAAAGTAFVTVGAAGGKRRPWATEVADLAHTTHDPLLAALRQRLRARHGAPRHGPIGVACVFSREAVMRPAGPAGAPGGAAGGSLNCAGFGSTVTVTAAFGLAAAQAGIDLVLEAAAAGAQAAAAVVVTAPLAILAASTDEAAPAGPTDPPGR